MLTISNLGIFWSELIGTAVLTLVGIGIGANVVLKKSKGYNQGWLLVVIGWGIAVFAGASLADRSGGHLNPAVTLALAISGKTSWATVPVYIGAQFVGAALGAVLCWLAFKLEFEVSENKTDTLGVFVTTPQVRNFCWNMISEIIATFVLIIFILANPHSNSALGYAAVAVIVVGIGAGLGGSTGYAINPARDIGPRFVYSVLPIQGKTTSDWGYAPVPILGPIIGAVLAAIIHNLFW